jgi:hypothetical protein
LDAGVRLLELYVTKTQSSVLVPKVVVDEVQNLYREIQDAFELEGTKIFLHYTLIFGVTLEVVIPGDDMWGWRSVSPPWVTREWVIPKALPFKLKPVTCVLFCDRRIQPSERGCRDP